MYQSLVRSVWASQLWLNYVVVAIPRVSNNRSLFLILTPSACGSAGCCTELDKTEPLKWIELNSQFVGQCKSCGQTWPRGPRTVMLSRNEQVGKDSAREGQQIFLSSPYLLQCIFGCSDLTRKSPRVFFFFGSVFIWRWGRKVWNLYFQVLW